MAEDIEVGRLSVPVEADLRKFDRQIKRDLKERAQSAARDAGRKAGQKVADGLEQAYRTRMARAKLELHSGAIDEASFKRRGQEAAEIFNRGLLREINRLRAGGVVSASRLHALTNQFKTAGRRAGAEFSEGVQETSRGGLQSLLPWIKGIFAIEVGQVIGQALRGAASYLRGARDAAAEVTRSYLRLGAASKLYGIEQETLNELAQRGRREMHLTAGVANELAANAAKIAGRADQAARSQELWAAALDLGAANGLKANEIAQALDQSYRGMDEGLNRLGLSDPGQLFKEFAEQAGKSADALSDAEKQQAIMNAIVEAARKVQGEYGRQLEGDLGRLNAWEMRLRNAREEIGASLIPVVVKLTEKMAGPLAAGVEAVTFLLEAMLSPMERLAHRMERMGAASELILPLTLQDRIAETRREIEELEEEIGEMTAPRAPAGLVGRPFAGRGDTGSLAGLSTTELAERRRELAALQSEASAAGDVDLAARYATSVIAIDELIAKQAALEEANKSLAATEEELQRAIERRDLRMELEAVDDRIAALTREGILTASLVAELDRLHAKREALQKQLGVDQPEPEEPAAPVAKQMTDAERKAAERLVQAARERHLDQIEKEVQTLREQADAARALADVELARELEAEADALERMNRWAQAFVPSLARMQDARGPALQETSPAESVAAYTDAFEQRMAALREKLAAGVIDEAGFRAQGERAAEAFNQGILSVLDGLREAGKLTREEFQKLAGLLKSTAGEEADPEKRIRDIERQAREYANVARAVLSVGDALGVIDDDFRSVLEGAILLAEQVRGIAAALEAGQGLSLTGLAGAVGGVAGIIGGIAGLLSGDSRAEEERRELLRRNNQALEALRLTLEGFRASQSNLEQARAVAASAAQDPVLQVALRNQFADDRATLEKFLRSRGFSLAEFEALAKEQGIELFDANGDIVFGAFQQLADALGLAISGLTKFTDTLEGQREQAELEADILDAPQDAAAKLQREFDLFAKFAPELVGQFALAGADLSTGEGRTRLEDALRAMFEAFKAGTLDLGDLTREEFLSLLRGMEGALDELAESGGLTGETAETRLAVSITEVQANRLLQYQASQLHHLAGMHAILRAGFGGPLPSITPPSPAALGLTPAPAAAPGGTTLEFGDIHLALSLDGVHDGAQAETLGRRVGEEFGEAFVDHLAARYRAAGLQRPRILTDQTPLRAPRRL